MPLNIAWSLSHVDVGVALSHVSFRIPFVVLRRIAASSVISAWSKRELSPVATASCARPEAITPWLYVQVVWPLLAQELVRLRRPG